MTFTYLPHNYGKVEGGCITYPAMGREGVDLAKRSQRKISNYKTCHFL